MQILQLDQLFSLPVIPMWLGMTWDDHVSPSTAPNNILTIQLNTKYVPERSAGAKDKDLPINILKIKFIRCLYFVAT